MLDELLLPCRNLKAVIVLHKGAMVKIGVIGYGYWGPNIVRNLQGLDSTCTELICDSSPSAQARARKAHPTVKIVSDANEVLHSMDIDAVAIITPVWTHYELVKKALENGKHVFIEKPFASNSAQAQELIDLAAQKNLQNHGRSHVFVHGRCTQDPRTY